MNSVKTIVYDCESQKLFEEIPDRNKIWDLLLSVAVTYCYEDDDYKFWTYNTQKDLIQYLNGNNVIGFNSIRFDNIFLLGEDCVHNEDGSCSSIKHNATWKNYDIYFEIVKRIFNAAGKPYSEAIVEVDKFRPPKGIYNLDSIAQATLNKKKSGTGCMAVEYFRTKRILELVQYCQQDVRVTKQLYEFIKKNGYVVTGSYDIIKFR